MCRLNFSHFPKFKKNYPFYPIHILKFIIFPVCFEKFTSKLRQDVNLSKKRKRIKTSERWEDVLWYWQKTFNIIG